MTRTITINGWDRFQHYKDRDPPWIKLYRDLLTSESWVLGTDVSRLVQVASTLLAARYSNSIPYDFRLIRKVASLDCTEAEFAQAIAHLSAHKFMQVNELEQQEPPRKQSASKPLATCTSETETETEQRQSRAEHTQTRAREEPRNDVPRETPAITPAGQACRLMREAGVMDVNPSHPHLLAALAEGVTPEQLRDIAGELPGKRFAYLVATARARRADVPASVARVVAPVVQTWTPPDDEPIEERPRAQA